MKKILMGMFAAVAILIASPALAECARVNAAGSSGYVNIREYPALNAPVVIRWNNPSHGSDWGSGYWCGQEYWDGERTWSFIQMETKDGYYIEGWASDKVLQFVD